MKPQIKRQNLFIKHIQWQACRHISQLYLLIAYNTYLNSWVKWSLQVTLSEIIRVTNLSQPVERKPAHNKVGEVLYDWEAGVDHPIRQPFSVVILLGRFQSSHWHVGRIHESDRVAYQLSAEPEY